jgi:hypothetical protein
MSDLTLEEKNAYYAKVRQSNYAASLRLEGFDTTPAVVRLPGDNRHLPAMRRSSDPLLGQEWNTCGTPAQKQKG